MWPYVTLGGARPLYLRRREGTDPRRGIKDPPGPLATIGDRGYPTALRRAERGLPARRHLGTPSGHKRASLTPGNRAW